MWGGMCIGMREMEDGQMYTTQSYIWSNINVVNAARWLLKVVLEKLHHCVRGHYRTMKGDGHMNCIRVRLLFPQSFCQISNVEGLAHPRAIR